MDNLSERTSKFAQLAPKIAQVGVSIAAAGQVIRQVIPEFDALGQSISNVAISAAGLGQIGALFGPIGAAIGTLAGALIGIFAEIRQTQQEQEQEQAAAAGAGAQTQNNIEINLNITGRTSEEISRNVAQAIRDALDDRSGDPFSQGTLREETRVTSRIRRGA